MFALVAMLQAVGSSAFLAVDSGRQGVIDGRFTRRLAALSLVGIEVDIFELVRRGRVAEGL